MSAELWPANAEMLLKHGVVKFIYRSAHKSILAACPYCGGRLIIDEILPYWLCMGPLTCKSSGKRFEEVIAALAVAEGEVTP